MSPLEALLLEIKGILGPAESLNYGGFHGGDPRDFAPDPECATEAEIAAWLAACEEFAAAEARGERPCFDDTHEIVRDDTGRMVCHIARNPYGLGTYIYRDPEHAALLARIDAQLAVLR